MEEIIEGWSCLSLLGPKGDGFKLRNEMGSVEFILAAKFYTKRVLNTDAIVRNFEELWRSWNGFKVKDLGNHIVLFIFDNKPDTNRILASQPWSFDEYLVVLQQYKTHMHARELCFDMVPFWVQVYDIPIRLRNKVVVDCICSGIRNVVSCDLAKMEGWEFTQARVIIDISKPLSQGHKITLDDGTHGWVSFKFERLPKYF